MRPLPLTLGLLTLAAAWFGPVSRSANHSFSAHMTVHMSVVAIAAPLLAYAIAGGRFDPARRVQSLFAPLLASALELGVVWGWHTPILHHAARASASAYFAEQGSFLIAGLALWIFSFGNNSESGRARNGAGMIALLLTAMHMTLLGALLGLAPRPFYEYAHPGALSPIEDQHLGGAIMLAIGGVSYLAGGLWLAWPLARGSISATPEMPAARAVPPA